MTDIAHIIQAELDRLNHSVERFANYGRHVAAALRSVVQELERTKDERDAIRAKTIEECAMAVDAINWIGPEGVDALTTAVKTIRALATASDPA